MIISSFRPKFAVSANNNGDLMAAAIDAVFSYLIIGVVAAGSRAVASGCCVFIQS
jgi:hypothetical protein